MKHRTISVTALITAGLLASSSVIADIKFRPRADIGIAAYELELNVPGETLGGDATYLKAGIGASIITGRWYFDLGYGTSINAEADSEGDKSDFERTDLTLTAGYVFQNNVTVFGGYKTGTSEFSNWANDPGFSEEFTADGIYGGAGINFPLGGNVLSLNAALALLDGEYSDNGGFTATADTIGISFGAGYNIPMSKTAGIVIKANYQSYDYDDWTSAGTNLDGVNANESILGVDVGYYATF